MNLTRRLRLEMTPTPMTFSNRFLEFVSHPASRYLLAILSAVVTYTYSPHFLRNMATWDMFAIPYVSLTMLMMHRCSPEETLQRAQKNEPSNTFIIASSMVTSVAAIAAVAEGSLKLEGLSTNMSVLHAILSLIGVISAWLFLNINFSLHYARLYYHDKDLLDDGDPSTFKQGLVFPGIGAIVHYWDFIYYAFTIAMCYQTSDVSITSPSMRRLTIVHAVFSFLFVLLLFGMVVNIIANVI